MDGGFSLDQYQFPLGEGLSHLLNLDSIVGRGEAGDKHGGDQGQGHGGDQGQGHGGTGEDNRKKLLEALVGKHYY